MGNWTLDEWKWLVDWSLLHKCNGWAMCMYGYWPFTLPGRHVPWNGAPPTSSSWLSGGLGVVQLEAVCKAQGLVDDLVDVHDGGRRNRLSRPR